MPAPAVPVPLGAWLTARGPFRQLRSALLDAEAHLNGRLPGTTPVQWHRLRAAVGFEAAVLTALDNLLVSQQVRLRMAEGRWLLTAVGGAGRESAAAVAIAVLTDAGGSGRLKRCRRGDCGQVFLDWTNGAQRSGCRLHPSRHVLNAV